MDRPLPPARRWAGHLADRSDCPGSRVHAPRGHAAMLRVISAGGCFYLRRKAKTPAGGNGSTSDRTLKKYHGFPMIANLVRVFSYIDVRVFEKAPKTEIPKHPNTCSTAGDHGDQEDLGVVRNGRFGKVRPGHVLIVDADYGVVLWVAGLAQQVRHRHSPAPGVLLAGHPDHAVTPLALSRATTSGKSMPRRLTVARVGMPSGVQPRRL